MLVKIRKIARLEMVRRLEKSEKQSKKINQKYHKIIHTGGNLEHSEIVFPWFELGVRQHVFIVIRC